MRNILNLFKDLMKNKKLILNLAKNDFKTKYAGSYFGIIWAFVQPIITILVFWFVFQIGLRVTPTGENVPFALWFICGLIPWFFFSDSLMNATNSFFEYSFLVKKVVFKVSILPLVKTLSSFFVHIVFVVFLLIVYMAYGYEINVYTLQVFYYSICTFVFVLSLSFITSSVVIFFKDLAQVISIFLQFGMWMTPIMWSYKIIPIQYRYIFKLNPMYYIVEGYRGALIRQEWFFHELNETIYFWTVTISALLIGVIVFKRLKNHFADVL